MNQTPQINITLDKTTPIECECGNRTFGEALMLRKVSRLIAGTAKDAVMPINVFVCCSCHQPLPESLPSDLPKD
jgi:hypothetical protein